MNRIVWGLHCLYRASTARKEAERGIARKEGPAVRTQALSSRTDRERERGV